MMAIKRVREGHKFITEVAKELEMERVGELK